MGPPHLRADEFDAALSSRGDLRAGLLALAMAHLEELSWVEVARILQNLPEGHVLERALLRYIARVYATTEEQVHRALEETRPERAQELAMTVAEEWIERGKEQGRQEGEARLLLWLLEQKFGAETVAFYRVTIEQASEEAVKDWSARVLAAERIEDVFRG